jgi:hypothetical protein
MGPLQRGTFHCCEGPIGSATELGNDPIEFYRRAEKRHQPTNRAIRNSPPACPDLDQLPPDEDPDRPN